MTEDEDNILSKQYELVDTMRDNVPLAQYLGDKSKLATYRLPKQVYYPFGCNASQKSAVEKALTHQVSIIQGPPGTGKTMIAAAIANEIGAKFCSVKPSDLLNQGAGNTEKAVRSLFAQARSFPVAVIYFDEMDSISPKSTKSQYAKQLRSEFLAQLQPSFASLEQPPWFQSEKERDF